MISFFDKNGSRAIYEKFRDSKSKENTLHTIVHYFISLHIPLAKKRSEEENTIRKSSLKQKNYDIKLSETDKLDPKHENYFKADLTRAQ